MVMVAAIFGLIVIVALVAAAYSLYRRRKNQQAMVLLAAPKGWQPLPLDFLTLSQSLPSYLVNRGVDQQFDLAFQTVIDGVSVKFFHFQYSIITTATDPQTGATTTDRQTYDHNVFQATLEKSYPQVLLMPHGMFSRIANLDEAHGLQRISLEGNFNDHFDTYIAPNSQIEALSLLAPDVMAQLLDITHDTTFDCYGQSLTMVHKASMMTPAEAEAGLQSLISLVKNIENKTTVSQFASPAPTTQRPRHPSRL